MTNALRKIRKVFVTLFLTGVTLVVLSIVLLAFPAVDSWIRDKIEQKVSAAIGCPLKIGELQYYPLRTVSLRSVSLLDRDSSVIASVSRIKASVEFTSIFNADLKLTQLDVDSLVLYIRQLSEDPSTYNISSFNGTDSIPADSAALFAGINIAHLRLRNSEVNYFPLDRKKFVVTGINAKIDDFSYANGGVSMDLSRLDMLVADRRSFASGNVYYGNDTLIVSSFKSYSANSIANIPRLTIAGISSVNRMSGDNPLYPSIEANIDLLSLDEPELAPRFAVAGSVQTRSDSVLLRKLTLDVFDNTHFTIDGNVSHWNDIVNSRVDLKMSNISLAPIDIINYTMADVSPKVVETLKPLSGTMSIYGPLSDLQVASQLFGPTMSVILDSKAHFHDDTEFDIDGTLASSYNPYNQTDLVLGSTTAVVDFVGLVSPETDNSFVHLKGNVPILTALGYAYQDVSFDCMANKFSQSAFLEVQDNNGNLTAVLTTDQSGKYPYYDITLNADSLYLGALGIMPSMPQSMLDCKARVAFNGTDIDDADGYVIVDNLTFSGGKDPVSFKRLDVRMKRQTNGDNRTITLSSDHITANIKGRFELNNLLSEFMAQLNAAAPSLAHQPHQRIPSNTWMDMELKYKDISSLSQMLDTNLVVSGFGRMSAYLRTDNHASSLVLHADKVHYGERECEGLELMYNSHEGDTSIVQCTAKSINLSSLGKLGAFNTTNKLYGDNLSSHFYWQRANAEPGGDISVSCDFSRDRHDELIGNVAIDSSYIVLGPRKWSIPTSSLIVSPHSLQVNGFSMTHGDRFLKVNGRSSLLNPADTVTVQVNKFAISDVLKTSPDDKFSLDGDVSALAYLNDLYGNIIVNCKSSIDSLYVDGDNLEHMDIQTAWQPENKNLDLHLGIVTHGKQCVDANGQLDIAQGSMFLNFDIDSLSIGFLNFYLDAAIRDMRGTTSGNLQLHGPLDDIKLDARLCVHKSDFSVMQTYVNYYINDNDSIILSPTRMEFKNLRFVDKYGKQGVFRGYIDHDMFSNLRLFIDFDVYDMLVLESQEWNNPTYYGTVFGNGYFGIRGNTSLCQLNVKAHTSPNSVFYILPLQKSELGQADYIRFSNKTESQEDSRQNAEEEEFNLEKHQEGVVANLQIDIRPNAKIYAIVDPRSDNMVEARGQGIINIDLTREGDLLMEGSYAMEQGAYNFNLQNIVNKKFDIRKGSTVMWNGDPYDAIVDLVATYKTRASLYDLVQGGYDESTADLKKRVPINCNLFLTEHLLNPKIRFEIEIPSSQNFSQYTFDQYVNTEEEMNRQVFSLLLAGRFYASHEAQSNTTNATGGASTSNYLGTTLSELMSNQFSNWISQNKYNVGMGVNYRPGDEVTNEEYEVALQTGVLDNKIILSGNIGYGRDVSSESNNESSFIGDFDVEVKLNKSETLRAKAYTHSNNDVIYETSPTTQGIGISYQESFDTFRDLLRKYFGWLRRKKSTEEDIVEESSAQQPVE